MIELTLNSSLCPHHSLVGVCMSSISQLSYNGNSVQHSTVYVLQIHCFIDQLLGYFYCVLFSSSSLHQILFSILQPLFFHFVSPRPNHSLSINIVISCSSSLFNIIISFVPILKSFTCLGLLRYIIRDFQRLV